MSIPLNSSIIKGKNLPFPIAPAHAPLYLNNSEPGIMLRAESINFVPLTSFRFGWNVDC
jgi:hypothetical protein